MGVRLDSDGTVLVALARVAAPAVLILVTTAAACVAQAQDLCRAPAQPEKIEGATTYVYESVNGTNLRLHVFNPADFLPSDKRAAIVFFFGGGWTFGDVAQFVPHARNLASYGMVAAVANYRVRCRHHSTPFDSLADARAALRWIRSHASKLGIDPNRIAAGGGSAGGHLALSLAVFDSRPAADGADPVSATPNALVLFNPVINLTGTTARKTTGLDAFGATIADRAEGISPLQHIHKGLPPTLILHGKDDTTVPYATAEEYCKASAALDNECRLVGYDGADHGFFNPDVEDGKWYRPTLLEAEKFLTRIGYLQPTAENRAIAPASSEMPTERNPAYEFWASWIGGTWRIDTQSDDGQEFHARSLYTWGPGKRFVIEKTSVVDADGAELESYENILAAVDDHVMKHRFASDGSVETIERETRDRRNDRKHPNLARFKAATDG